MSGLAERLRADGLAARDALGGWGVAAVVALVLAVVVVVVSLLPLAREWFGLRVGDIPALEAEQEERIVRYAEAMEGREREINGRSMFFVPPAPAEIAEAEKDDEEEPRENGPPPRPTRYGGPSVIAVVNGRVWLGSDRRVGVGEEADGVRVVSVEGSPWTVRLEWRGVEFDVEVFERTTDRFMSEEEVGQ